MTTVSAGSSSSYTFAQNEQALVSPAQGEACEVEVRKAGALIAGRRITSEMSFGPFDAGDVMQLTAQRGAVDYTISTYTDLSIDAAESAAIQAMVSAAWKNGLRPEPLRRFRPVLSVEDATLWDDRAGSGMTVSVDTTVLFGGRPTLRLDIPALSSGTYRVGTSAAVCDMPYSWDGKGLTLAVMTSNASAVPGPTSVFLGDAAFTNFNAHSGLISPANLPTANWVANEWMVGRCTAVTPTGSPTYPGQKRIRFNLTVTSNASACTVWVGFVGVVAPKKPAVVISIDDGYRTGYDFVADLARFYKLPVSFGIDRYYVQQGGALFMTEAMIRELHADTSDLFEFVTHGYSNTSLSGAGSAALYVQQQVDTRAYLRTLGIAGDGPNHHPWVQSVYDNAAVAALKAAGFLSARIGGASIKSLWDGHFYTGQDKQVFQQFACISPTTGLTVNDLQTAVNAAVTEGYGLTHVNMHQAGAADAASPLTWTWAKWIDAFGWLAAQRDAGTIDIKCWGRAYADAVGVGYVK